MHHNKTAVDNWCEQFPETLMLSKLSMTCLSFGSWHWFTFWNRANRQLLPDKKSEMAVFHEVDETNGEWNENHLKIKKIAASKHSCHTTGMTQSLVWWKMCFCSWMHFTLCAPLLLSLRKQNTQGFGSHGCDRRLLQCRDPVKWTTLNVIRHRMSVDPHQTERDRHLPSGHKTKWQESTRRRQHALQGGARSKLLEKNVWENRDTSEPIL